MTSESPDLAALLAQAEEKLRAKGMEEEARKAATVEGNLQERESAIAKLKSSASESEAILGQVAEAKEKVAFGQQEIAAIQAKEKILMAAGMVTELLALYDVKNAELATRRQELADREAQLSDSEEQLSKASETSDAIVPPTMAETVTPEQKTAREALEGQAHTEETIREGEKVYDEAKEENKLRHDKEMVALIDKLDTMLSGLRNNIPQEELERSGVNINDLSAIRSALNHSNDIDGVKSHLIEQKEKYGTPEWLGKELEDKGFFKLPYIADIIKIRREMWEKSTGRKHVEE